MARAAPKAPTSQQDFQVGDVINVSCKVKLKLIKQTLTVVHDDIRKSFIVVTNGLYKDTIDRFLVNQGKIKIEKVGRIGGMDHAAANI